MAGTDCWINTVYVIGESMLQVSPPPGAKPWQFSVGSPLGDAWDIHPRSSELFQAWPFPGEIKNFKSFYFHKERYWDLVLRKLNVPIVRRRMLEKVLQNKFYLICRNIVGE